jgi:hypothetical protein
MLPRISDTLKICTPCARFSTDRTSAPTRVLFQARVFVAEKKVSPEESGPTGSSEREGGLPDSQIIFHREDARNSIRDDSRYVLVHLVHYDAFE